MMLELATVVALARQCAPSVAAETLISVVHAESRFNPYAIGVNAKNVVSPKPGDRASAIAAAQSLLARGYNIDLGLGQINSANLKRLGMTVEDTFDPCRNLAAAARVLAANYTSVARSVGSTDDALASALSMYNTGNASGGFSNGYVGKVYASSSVVVPAIRGGAPVGTGEPASPPAPAPTVASPSASRVPQPTWDTSADGQLATLMVFGSGSPSSSKGLHQ